MTKNTLPAGSEMRESGFSPTYSCLRIVEKLKAPFIALTTMFTPVDDHWTWTLEDGRVFESVIPIEVEKGQVTIEHKGGCDVIPMNELCEDLQRTLMRDMQFVRPDAAYTRIGVGKEFGLAA